MRETGRRRGSFSPSEGEWESVCASLRLSPRESQIARWILEDETERTIANRLGISSHTVHARLQRLYRKVGVRSREQLIVRLLTEWIALQRE
jgi:DNA-binding CsgD family transcriptional regulator